MAGKPRPLSWPQERFLRALNDGVPPQSRIYGQSAFGGLENTRAALIRRGLIEIDHGRRLWVLTDAGRAALGLTETKGQG